MAKRFRKLHGDPIIWLVVLLLAMISIVAVYSSSSALAYKNDTTTSAYLLKQSVFVIIGFAFLLACYIFPLKGYRLLSLPIFAIAVGCLGYVIGGGQELNEGIRWIKIWKITFQPSELAKIAVVLYLARILEAKSLKTFKAYAIWILAPLGITCVLSLYGSVSATLIICLTAFAILVCAGIKWRYIWYTIGIAAVAVTIIFAINKLTGKFNRIETFTARIERFFVKEDLSAMTAEELKNHKDKNLQSDQAKEAIQLGGFFGRGPGNSLKKDTLPHPYSDFIFALIVEEMGLMGGMAVILLYLWFFSRCIAIARSCSRTDTTIMVLGLGFLITLQAFIHILVNVGIFPVTGQTLPLVSLGGTSYVIMSCAFGIILSVNRTIEIKYEDKESVKNE